VPTDPWLRGARAGKERRSQCPRRENEHSSPVPGRAERIADLRTVERLLEENREALIRAISRDYGQRSEFETLLASTG
jgi:hypothetical protein